MFVTARAKLGATVFDVIDGVRAQVDGFEPRLPPDIRLERGFDQAVTVEHRLGSLGRDFLIAIGLVLLTLLPLGYRASLVVMVSIPLSLSMGVVALQFLGYSLNQLSIAGFVLALGLLVDDSIVVTENIARRLREGLAPRDAAIAGVSEINIAVVGLHGHAAARVRAADVAAGRGRRLHPLVAGGSGVHHRVVVDRFADDRAVSRQPRAAEFAVRPHRTCSSTS